MCAHNLKLFTHSFFLKFLKRRCSLKNIWLTYFSSSSSSSSPCNAIKWFFFSNKWHASLKWFLNLSQWFIISAVLKVHVKMSQISISLLNSLFSRNVHYWLLMLMFLYILIELEMKSTFCYIWVPLSCVIQTISLSIATAAVDVKNDDHASGERRWCWLSVQVQSTGCREKFMFLFANKFFSSLDSLLA